MLLWTGFIALIFILLALDLGVFHKRDHTISTKEAFRWTTLWVSLSLLFSIFIYFAYERGWVANSDGLSGQQAMIKYVSGYLVEQSLSMDNIFVIALIFAYFKVPPQFQHRVLFWGILGALFFRGVMIAIGVVLINKFDWIIYFFGAFLLYSAFKMLRSGDHVELSGNPVIRWIRRFFPVTKEYDGHNFFVRRKHITAATPLFVALLVIETTDIMFAVDSIPAIFAITTDPFLIFTSNIFAILGLRSLYFVLASMITRFQYLRYSLVLILFFVGVKMLLHDYWHPEEWLSLGIIVLSLAGGIAASLAFPPKEDPLKKFEEKKEVEKVAKEN
jgi:tellurite resistance protein TerC